MIIFFLFGFSYKIYYNLCIVLCLPDILLLNLCNIFSCMKHDCVPFCALQPNNEKKALLDNNNNNKKL